MDKVNVWYKDPFWYKMVLFIYLIGIAIFATGALLYKAMGIAIWSLVLLIIWSLSIMSNLIFLVMALISWKDIKTNFKILLSRHKGYGIYNIVRANKVIDRIVAKLESNPEIAGKKRLINKEHIYYVKQSPIFFIPHVFIPEDSAMSIPLKSEDKVNATRFSEALKLAVSYGMSKALGLTKDWKSILILLVSVLNLLGLFMIIYLMLKAQGVAI